MTSPSPIEAPRAVEAGRLALSVIVPVYNDRAGLSRSLPALAAGAGPDVEIIVVDDASTDDSAAVASRFPARLIRMPANAGPAAARNSGARQATGDILVFVDSDVVVAPGALDRVAR